MVLPLLVLSLCFGFVESASGTGASSTQSAATQPSPEVAAMLKGLEAKRDRLHLSTDEKSASENFSFRMDVQPPPGARAQLFGVLAGRMGDKIGVLIIDAQGQPYCYLTNGMVVAMDPDRVGGLVMHEGGGVEFVVSGDDEKTTWSMGYQSRKPNRLEADPLPFMRYLLKRGALAALDEQGRLVISGPKGSAVMISPATDERAYPIRLFALRPPGGGVMALADVDLSDKTAKRVVGHTAAEVKALGLPLRILSDQEVGRLRLAPPPDFGKAKEDQAAARRFNQLFAAQPATQPAATQPSPEVAAALKGIEARRDRLHLSTDEKSVSDKFSFRFDFKPPPGTGTQAIGVLAGRIGEKIGLLIIDSEAQPYCYMTDGLLVALDPDRPGGLVLHEGGGVEFVLPGGVDTMNWTMAYRSRKPTRLEVDPMPLVEAAFKKAMVTSRDEQGRILIRSSTGNAVVIIPSQEGEAYPIRQFALSPPRGGVVALSQVELSDKFAKRVVGHTAAEIKALGLPLRILSDQEVSRLPLAPPADAGKAREERAAAKRFHELFAAQPETRPVD